jgi:hypothetical protein
VRSEIVGASRIIGDVSAAVVESSHSVRDAEWVAQLRAAETAARQAQAAVLELLADPEAAEIATRTGYGRLARLVSAALLVSPGEARARVAAAEALCPRRTLTREELPPRYPATAAGVRAGQISLPAARTVMDTMVQIPVSVHPEEAAQAEQALAGYAQQFEPRALAGIGRRVLAHLNPDGQPPADPRPHPGPELLLRPDRNGMTRLDGRLDAEGAAVVRTVLDSLNQRRPPDESGPDTRTLARRNADALVEACSRLLDDAALPTSGGQRPHLVVTMGLGTLRDGIGAATLEYGDLVDAETARRLACDASVIPVVLGGDSQPLDVGQARRVATRAQRVALIARDGGCAFPGCDTPPARCTAHHIAMPLS